MPGSNEDFLPGGSLAKPLMVALGALLIGKMMSGGSSSASAQSNPQAAAATPSGGSTGQEGGLFGGLGGLLNKLEGAGHKDTINSWVGSGQNKPIDPQQLGSVLGQKTISELAQQSGMSEQELLAQLSKALPGLVDKLTPGGQLPNQQQVASFLRRQSAA